MAMGGRPSVICTGVVGTGVSGVPDDSPDQSRQQMGNEMKESRQRTKMGKDLCGRWTMVVGGGKSGWWKAQGATREGGGRRTTQ